MAFIESKMNANNLKKRKRPLFNEAAPEFERALLENVLPRIVASGDPYVAIGVDMAAQEDKWGLSIITLRDSGRCGTLRLLLPFRSEIDGFPKKKYPIKPSSHFLCCLISGLRDKEITCVVAVDIPFGWSLEHLSFLETWSALNADQPDARCLPELNRFKFRLCDLQLMKCLNEQGCSSALFAVGADRIASAAFKWAKLRCELFHRLGNVDLGFPSEKQLNGVVYFETYPSAFVRLNYPDCTEYKTGKADLSADSNLRRQAKKKSQQKARQTLMSRIVKEYGLSHDATEKSADAACSTSASDSFDGFLSSIAAWDYLNWRSGRPASLRMSSPLELLGCEGATKERKRVEQEGWILVRMPSQAASCVLSRTDA